MRTSAKLLPMAGILFFCAFQNVQAQITASVGLQGGVHLATNEGKNLDGQKYIVGGLASIPIEIGINRYFAVQPEIQFIQKGVAYETSSVEQDLRTSTVTNYLNMPILFKGRYQGERFGAEIFAGPELGFSINRYQRTKLGDDSAEFDKVKFSDEGDPHDNRLEFGLTGGVGFFAHVGPGKLVLSGRYNLGLTDLQKFDNDKPGGYEATYNRGFGLSLGYMLTL